VFRRYLTLSIGLLIWGCQLGAEDAPALQIHVAEGDGSTYAIGSRATRGITIQITDDAGKPLDGVTVTFRLPDAGPGGTFANGSKTEILTTHADGRAGVWGMKWNRQAGTFDVRITATKGEARAGTVSSQHLTETSGPSAPKLGSANHKWLWIALVAGAAGAGAAVAARNSSGSNNCSSTVVLPQNPCTSTPSSLGVTIIGQPTINLGHP
jgi:hypothetical protein